MTGEGKPCERKPTLWIRLVDHAQVEDFIALGWVDRGPLPFRQLPPPHLIEWPGERGEPVDPPQEEQR